MKFTYPNWHPLHKKSLQNQLRHSADKSGLAPGSLVHIGEMHDASTTISVIQYNEENLIHHKDVLFSEHIYCRCLRHEL